MFKYICTIFSLFILSLLFPINVNAQEKITDYVVNIEIQEDGKIKISEEIVYDFGSQEKHGIYRNIPLIKENEEGKRFKMTFENISVTRDGINEIYETKTNKELEIKIGDPNKTITGEHVYKINYTVSGALTYFEDFDELYWNVNGTEWEVPIQHLFVSVLIPEDIPDSKLQYNCYTGEIGSTDSNCVVRHQTENFITYETTQPLNSGENMTVVLNFPKGYIAELFPQEIKRDLLTTILLVFGAVGLIILNVLLPAKKVLQLIKQRSQLKKQRQVVAAWFEPPQKKDGSEFSPAETRAILEGKADAKSITSEIIHLAQEGYLKIISEGKKNFRFKLLKQPDNNLKDFQKLILNSLFSGADSLGLKEGFQLTKDIVKETQKARKEAKESGKRLSSEDIKNIQSEAMSKLVENKTEVTLKEIKKSQYFGSKYQEITEKMVGHLDEEGIYSKDLNKLKTKNSLIAVGSAFLLGFVNTAVYIIAAIYEKPRTNFGIDAYSKAQSLKNFLRSQEEQLEFQADRKMLFEKLLPYATAFGVEKTWLKRFKDITLQDTDWYQGDLSTMQFAGMTSAMASSVKSAHSSVQTSSSGFSSGSSGGFSGGGGGGGGGGSW